MTKEAPQPGDRAPDSPIGQSSQHLYDYFRTPHHKLLLFTGRMISPADLNQLKKIVEKTKQNYSKTMTSFVISQEEIPGITTILDSDFSLSQQYGCSETPGICLICPDLFNEAKIQAFFDKYLRPANF